MRPTEFKPNSESNLSIEEQFDKHCEVALFDIMLEIGRLIGEGKHIEAHQYMRSNVNEEMYRIDIPREKCRIGLATKKDFGGDISNEQLKQINAQPVCYQYEPMMSLIMEVCGLKRKWQIQFQKIVR